jgi:hypothetical protein
MTGLTPTVSLFDLIDLRSFSNVWYWIFLVLFWASATHWILGIPYDLVTRARRGGAAAQAELDVIARVHVARILHFAASAGIWIYAVLSFVLSVLLILGFVYAVSFAQAVFLLALPMAVLYLMGVATAGRIQADDAHGIALCDHLTRHRTRVQVIGTLFIFVTAFWGMYQTLAFGVLGG